MPEWTLYVRDAAREAVAVLDDYASAVFALNFNDVGGWHIRGVPMASDAGQALVPGAGIIAVRDGVVEMAGPLLFPTVRWDYRGYVLDASGASDDLALWARLCYPDAPSTNLNGDYSDDRSGVASTVMRQYVDVNAGPGADAAREWSGLVLAADPAIGSAVSFSARLTVLGELLRQLALAGGGLGFRVVQDLGGTDLEFQVYDPADRTGTAQFSPAIGNVESYAYSRKAPTVTRAIVGGQGDGTLRTFVERADAAAEATWGMRLEAFVDQRQTAVVAELEQAGDEELADQGEQVSVDLVPVDTLAVPYRTGYEVGDLVTVVVDGVPIQDRVQSVEITLDGEGEKIKPTVGTPGAVEAGASDEAAMDLLLSRMLDLARRLSRLATAQ